MQHKKVTIDGNEACAQVAYQFTEIAGIYPITPSSPMAEKTDEWSAAGKENMFGQPVKLIEMQSEAGAIGVVHGALESGALATTFTSSQGLMLMIPCLHIISGHRHPGVLHVAARTVGTHANSIFGDHQDVMDCRSTGVAMFATGSVQEIADIAAVAHLGAIKSRIPFIHFFDGFRTSHEIQKIEQPDLDRICGLLDHDALDAWRACAQNPDHPIIRTTVQGPDVYFQNAEASNGAYFSLPAIVEEYLGQISAITGREHHLFDYYGAPDAIDVIIGMGSVGETAQEVVTYLTAQGEKVGYLSVHLYRPFSVEHFLAALPASVQRIAVLDRYKDNGGVGEALFEDVCTAFTKSERAPKIYGGRYGLSSKNTTPGQIRAVYDNLRQPSPKSPFTIGIVDDVTHLSLTAQSLHTEPKGAVSCRFWGLGSDGTVGANKSAAKIIGDHTDMYTQGYFEYDTKKSYGITKSNLRFSPKPIQSSYLVESADFVACHNESYVDKYDMVQQVKPGGVFLLNCQWDEQELDANLPADMKRYIAQHDVRFYIINAYRIAGELGLGNKMSIILQAAFFSLTKMLPWEDAKQYIEEKIRHDFAKKGQAVVEKNISAIDAGVRGLVRVQTPTAWKNVRCGEKIDESIPREIRDIVIPINRQKGDELPVSAFIGHEDGSFHTGSTAYEKRGIAVQIPSWNAEKCLQCNRCAYVCPHAAIRPYLLNEGEAACAPRTMQMTAARGQQAAAYRYSLQVSSLNCTGCGSCVAVCPAPEKAIEMVPAREILKETAPWDYALTVSEKRVFDPYTLKGSQFRQPLLEFSGACAGCGETPYAKLISQLYGSKAYWINAIGCSMAWAAAMPSFPYTTDKNGRGPSWVASLFENQAEAGLGVYLGARTRRNLVKLQAQQMLELTADAALTECLHDWLDTYDDLDRSEAASDKLASALRMAMDRGVLTAEAAALAGQMLKNKDQFSKKTVWLFGGDGWAYDIGFGGLDHVVASGEDINIFIVDTEVYSNTGGQASKATPLGASAQFAAAGKRTKKKDLGRQLMTYGDIYVAQVAMGADPNQLLRAVKEAVAFKGPSVIIAYAPCISHGIKAGMNKVQEEMRRVVRAGMWVLYRYNPLHPEDPMTIDSPAPDLPYRDFLMGQNRYASLLAKFPEIAEALFDEGEQQVMQRYNAYVRQAQSLRQEEKGEAK